MLLSVGMVSVTPFVTLAFFETTYVISVQFLLLSLFTVRNYVGDSIFKKGVKFGF